MNSKSKNNKNKGELKAVRTPIKVKPSRLSVFKYHSEWHIKIGDNIYIINDGLVSSISRPAAISEMVAGRLCETITKLSEENCRLKRRIRKL
jgi:hypothetical protein